MNKIHKRIVKNHDPSRLVFHLIQKTKMNVCEYDTYRMKQLTPVSILAKGDIARYWSEVARESKLILAACDAVMTPDQRQRVIEEMENIR